jgi:hypothetical protein
VDDLLMIELRRVVTEVDPVPEAVFVTARAAISTRDLDGELAVLVADSAAASRPGPPAGSLPIRGDTGGAGRRLLSFASGRIQLDLEVRGRGRLLNIIGQLTGGAVDGCTLEHTGGREALSLDSLGRFTVTGAHPGPFRVRCRSTTGVWVTTAWVTL